MNTRYLNAKEIVPKSRELRELLFSCPDREFRIMTRMDKVSFVRIHEILQNCPIFGNRSRYPQTPLCYQLLVVLRKLGCDGNGAGVVSTVSK
jgi:hypothetical protein